MKKDAQVASLLAVVAGMIEWAEDAGIRGDHGRLWRRHDALLARLYRSHATTDDALARVRFAEVDAWIETLHAMLRADILRALSGTLAPAEDGVWVDLDPDRRLMSLDARTTRARSSVRTVATAACRFHASPGLAHLHDVLDGVERLIVERRVSAMPADVSLVALARLVDALVRTLPPVALEFLSEMVQERFNSRIDAPSLAEVANARTRRLQRVWTPSWERLEMGHARVEAARTWFVPDAQRCYEERRSIRELDQAHEEALAEDRRRTLEITQAEERRVNEERRLRQESERAAAAERRRRALARATEIAKEEAKRNVTHRLMDRHLTLKHVPEPERTRMLRQEEARLLRSWGW